MPPAAVSIEHGHARGARRWRAPTTRRSAQGGLRLRVPDDGDVVLDVPTVSDPADVHWAEDDVVLLATRDPGGARPTASTVFRGDAQNLGRAERPKGWRCGASRTCTASWCCSPPPIWSRDRIVLSASGITDAGVDDIDTSVAADLSTRRPLRRRRVEAGLKLLPQSSTTRSRRRAPTFGPMRRRRLAAQARAEAEACFVAVGWRWNPRTTMPSSRPVSTAPVAARRRRLPDRRLKQSLLRHVGSTEVDYLNGEIVLLGRLHELSTPPGQRRMAVEGREPGRCVCVCVCERERERERESV